MISLLEPKAKIVGIKYDALSPKHHDRFNNNSDVCNKKMKSKLTTDRVQGVRRRQRTGYSLSREQPFDKCIHAEGKKKNTQEMAIAKIEIFIISCRSQIPCRNRIGRRSATKREKALPQSTRRSEVHKRSRRKLKRRSKKDCFVKFDTFTKKMKMLTKQMARKWTVWGETTLPRTYFAPSVSTALSTSNGIKSG